MLTPAGPYHHIWRVLGVEEPSQGFGIEFSPAGEGRVSSYPVFNVIFTLTMPAKQKEMIQYNSQIFDECQTTTVIAFALPSTA